MNMITEKTVDIEKILKGKMGSKARWVPGFAVNWLKRIAHEDQVNGFLWEARDLKGTPWLEATMRHLNTKIEVNGMENLPPKDDGRRYTFVSNHPMGGSTAWPWGRYWANTTTTVSAIWSTTCS